MILLYFKKLSSCVQSPIFISSRHITFGTLRGKLSHFTLIITFIVGNPFQKDKIPCTWHHVSRCYNSLSSFFSWVALLEMIRLLYVLMHIISHKFNWLYITWAFLEEDTKLLAIVLKHQPLYYFTLL